MINISSLHKSFGDRALFLDASLRVGARDRIALVGPNGSGKTTLVEMIMGLQDPDTGVFEIPRDVTLGYLPQETDRLRGRSVIEEVLSAAPSMAQAGHRLAVLERDMAEADGEERAQLLAEYATLQERFEALGGYAAEADARTILAGLGFDAEAQDRRTDALSGGWLMRVALAKLLLASPDALLLDEPTNHLDLDSVVWLEEFLERYPGAVLLISHDREFMNSIATRVVEIDRARLETYTGNFAAFVEQRAQRIRQAEAAAKNQARRVAQLEVFINRFRYKNTKARQVQSKIKMLDRMEKVDAPTKQRRKMALDFPVPPRSGRVVLELERVRFAYGERLVYEDLHVAIERAQKVALVGPNGAGKTTLLKLLAGALTPQAGERRPGHNVSLGYFAQHQIEALDPANRVIEELARAIPPGVDVQARALLGRFLFSGDDVDKPVAVLSGGERSRLAMAKLLVAPHNVLCLDEPTNHLDMPSRDVLEEALEDYEGALVFITHDRHLIRSIANRIMEVQPGGKVRAYEGDYDSYLDRTKSEQVPAAVTAQRSAKVDDARERRRAGAEERARRNKQRKALRTVEQHLEAAVAERDSLAEQLADPGFYAAGDGVADAVRAYGDLEQRVAVLENEWEQLAAEAEA